MPATRSPNAAARGRTLQRLRLGLAQLQAKPPADAALTQRLELAEARAEQAVQRAELAEAEAMYWHERAVEFMAQLCVASVGDLAMPESETCAEPARRLQ